MFTVWFQDFVTAFNQSYNCQTSHYLGRNRPLNARLSILLLDPWMQHRATRLLSNHPNSKLKSAIDHKCGSKHFSASNQYSAPKLSVLESLISELVVCYIWQLSKLYDNDKSRLIRPWNPPIFLIEIFLCSILENMLDRQQDHVTVCQ